MSGTTGVVGLLDMDEIGRSVDATRAALRRARSGVFTLAGLARLAGVPEHSVSLFMRGGSMGLARVAKLQRVLERHGLMDASEGAGRTS